MNWKHKLGLGVLLLALVAVLMSIPVCAGAVCPAGAKIYVSGPVTDANAVRGTEKNPAANKTEAKDVCVACGGGAYLYEYSALQGKYVRYGTCVTVFPEMSGAPLAQSVLLILLAVVAVGLVAWGLLSRAKLRRA